MKFESRGDFYGVESRGEFLWNLILGEEIGFEPLAKFFRNAPRPERNAIDRDEDAVPGHQHFIDRAFRGERPDDLEPKRHRAGAQVAHPEFGRQEVVQVRRRMKIGMELRADRIDVELLEGARIGQPHFAIKFRLGDLEKTDVTAEINDAGVIDVGPADPLLDRKSFAHPFGNYYSPPNVPQRDFSSY